ncbi:MAG TPA: nucleotide exchange factor GrpE [Vicinamibacterales bacterium]|nr:nucleotide exchange factor GrpE [Vicinamibacterales bacterium]
MTTNDEMNGATEEAAAELDNPLQQERDELQDRLLRTVAEFDNYRKRTDRERRDLSDFITSDILRELLPVLDDLERALAAPANLKGHAEFSAFHQGVTLIHRQWLDLLRRRGVEPLDVLGKPFDPEWHESVANEPANGRPDGEITGELRRGYRIGSKLLRAAMVRVAKA